MATRKTVCVLLGIACITAASFLAGDALQEHSINPRARRINCVNNLQEIGMAFRTWALDNSNSYPCNVPTNAGGVMEVCAVGADGFEKNPAATFQVMSNELSIPKILVCPHDKSKIAATNFPSLTSNNITYRLRSGPEISDTHWTNVLAICPICGNVLRCDGSVTVGKDDGQSGEWFDDRGADQVGARSVASAFLVAVLGGVLLWVGVRR